MRLITNFQKSHMTPEEQQDYENSRYDSLELCTSFEASMDELTGLITGYDILFRLVDNKEIRDQVRLQVSKLADYLSEYGYFLVRPGGGCCAHAVPLEFSSNRVFKRITGNDFSARVDFVGAMKKADVWNCLAGPVGWYTVIGITIESAVPIL